MRRTLLLLAAVVAVLPLGCHANGNRPRLFDRLFHRDDDCPSDRSAARNGACDRPGLTLGAPVSYGTPVMAGDPYTIGPGAFDGRPDNELPAPRINQPATPVPTSPNSLSVGGR